MKLARFVLIMINHYLMSKNDYAEINGNKVTH